MPKKQKNLCGDCNKPVKKSQNHAVDIDNPEVVYHITCAKRNHAGDIVQAPPQKNVAAALAKVGMIAAKPILKKVAVAAAKQAAKKGGKAAGKKAAQAAMKKKFAALSKKHGSKAVKEAEREVMREIDAELSKATTAVKKKAKGKKNPTFRDRVDHASNMIRDMFLSKQYDGRVYQRDINKMLKGAQWHRRIGGGKAEKEGAKALKKAWKELQDEGYVSKVRGKWQWKPVPEAEYIGTANPGAAKFTKKERTKAMKAADDCPVCGEAAVVWDSAEIEDNLVVQTAYCGVCDSAWHLVWEEGDGVLTSRRGKALEPGEDVKPTHKCPVCRGDNVDWDTIDPEGTLMVQPAYCPDCDSAWHDIYDIADAVLTSRKGEDVSGTANPWVVKHDGKEVARFDTETEVYRYMHQKPYSVHHATTYEGYSIEHSGGAANPRTPTDIAGEIHKIVGGISGYIVGDANDVSRESYDNATRLLHYAQGLWHSLTPAERVSRSGTERLIKRAIAAIDNIRWTQGFYKESPEPAMRKHAKHIGYYCAGCEDRPPGKRYWVRDTGDPDPTAPARKKLEKHDDRVHGGCRPTWVPVFDDMVDERGHLVTLSHERHKMSWEGNPRSVGSLRSDETYGDVLNRLATTQDSSELDGMVVQNLLRKSGFPKAVVTSGIVYLEGHGTVESPPTSIHTLAATLLQILPQTNPRPADHIAASVLNDLHLGAKRARDQNWVEAENQAASASALFHGALNVGEQDRYRETAMRFISELRQVINMKDVPGALSLNKEIGAAYQKLMPLSDPRKNPGFDPTARHPTDGIRKHKLLTKEIMRTLPPLYSTEKTPAADKIVHVKFFSPYTGFYWYGMEFDGEDRFFGLAYVHEPEMGYFSLSELKNLTRGRLPMVERDCYFDPKPLKDIKDPVVQEYLSMYGKANPNVLVPGSWYSISLEHDTAVSVEGDGPWRDYTVARARFYDQSWQRQKAEQGWKRAKIIQTDPAGEGLCIAERLLQVKENPRTAGEISTSAHGALMGLNTMKDPNDRRATLNYTQGLWDALTPEERAQRAAFGAKLDKAWVPRGIMANPIDEAERATLMAESDAFWKARVPQKLQLFAADGSTNELKGDVAFVKEEADGLHAYMAVPSPHGHYLITPDQYPNGWALVRANPLKRYEKWDGSTDSGSEYARLRGDPWNYGSDEAVAIIEGRLDPHSTPEHKRRQAEEYAKRLGYTEYHAGLRQTIGASELALHTHMAYKPVWAYYTRPGKDNYAVVVAVDGSFTDGTLNVFEDTLNVS